MTKKGFRPSGLTQKSFENMITGAGALYFGIDYQAVTPATTAQEFAIILQQAAADGKALGATTGGITFTATPKVRQIEVDDLYAPIAGSTVMDGWESVTLSTTIKELTRQNIERIMTTAHTDPKTGAVKFGSVLTPQHFEHDITWVTGRTDGGLLAIPLRGALNMAGITITSTNGGEGTVSVEFAGHLKDLEEIQAGNAPFDMFFFDADGANVTGLASAFADIGKKAGRK